VRHLFICGQPERDLRRAGRRTPDVAKAKQLPVRRAGERFRLLSDINYLNAEALMAQTLRASA
jgi:hypothetical protein